jgi:hypothetical protein
VAEGLRQRTTAQQILYGQGQELADRVRDGVVVRDVRLRLHGCAHGGWRLAEGRQGHRQHAHRGTIAGVVIRRRRDRNAGLAESHQVPADGIADIDRLAPHPGIEGPGAGQGNDAAAVGQDGLAQGQRHARIVGHLTWPELEPAATDDLAMHAEVMNDFARRHEFDRGAQRVAQRQAQIGGLGPCQQRPGNTGLRAGWRHAYHRLGYSTRMSSSRTMYWQARRHSVGGRSSTYICSICACLILPMSLRTATSRTLSGPPM